MLVQLAIIPFGAKGESPTRRCGMDGYNPPELPWGPAAAAADVAQGLRQKREQRRGWLEQRGGSAQEAELAQSLEQQAYPPPPPAPPNFWACQGAMAQACSYAAYFRTKDEPPAQQQACLQCATNPKVMPFLLSRGSLLVPLPAVSWPWVPAWGSLEPPRQDGENAQKTRKNGAKMGEIRPKRCEGRELTKDQLGSTTRAASSPDRPAAPSSTMACWLSDTEAATG